MNIPRLFYFCYSHQLPRGGQKETYRHVDILNANGWDAYIYHPSESCRLTWFTNSTKVVGPTQFEALFDPKTDFLVLPEDLGWKINEYPGRKVIFNKGVARGYAALGDSFKGEYPYTSRDVVAAFVMSEQNREHLQLAFPKLNIHRMYQCIDTTLFSYRPLAAKMPRIAVVPKAAELTYSVCHTINARGATGINHSGRFEWVVLRELNEQQIASCLQDALLVVFASVSEGAIPGTLLEAMACGCLVAVYGVGAMLEGLPSYANFALGDLPAIVRFIEEVMTTYPNNIEQWQGLADVGRDLAASYSSQQQCDTLLAAWADIVDS